MFAGLGTVFCAHALLTNAHRMIICAISFNGEATIFMTECELEVTVTGLKHEGRRSHKGGRHVVSSKY